MTVRETSKSITSMLQALFKDVIGRAGYNLKGMISIPFKECVNGKNVLFWTMPLTQDVMGPCIVYNTSNERTYFKPEGFSMMSFVEAGEIFVSEQFVCEIGVNTKDGFFMYRRRNNQTCLTAQAAKNSYDCYFDRRFLADNFSYHYGMDKEYQLKKPEAFLLKGQPVWIICRCDNLQHGSANLIYVAVGDNVVRNKEFCHSSMEKLRKTQNIVWENKEFYFDGCDFKLLSSQILPPEPPQPKKRNWL